MYLEVNHPLKNNASSSPETSGNSNGGMCIGFLLDRSSYAPAEMEEASAGLRRR